MFSILHTRMKIILQENDKMRKSRANCFWWFEEVARFGSFWKNQAKSEQAKSNHLQAAFTKSMYTEVSWSRWGSILDLLGSFCSIQVGDNAPGRILGTLNFGVLWVKKFKFRSVENMGYGCRNSSISEKVKNLVKEVYWWNVVVVWGFEWQHLIFENFYMVFRWG